MKKFRYISSIVGEVISFLLLWFVIGSGFISLFTNSDFISELPIYIRWLPYVGSITFSFAIVIQLFFGKSHYEVKKEQEGKSKNNI